MLRCIGGFFEEETLLQKGTEFHANAAYKLVNGRSSLLLILKQIKPAKVMLPFYSCDTLLKPLQALKIPYEYYPLNIDLLPNVNEIKPDEFFIIINFFGLFEDTILRWASEVGLKNFVVDNTQSFFSKPNAYMAFNSARKFFGITDGSYLFCDKFSMKTELEEIFFDDTFLSLRKRGDIEGGYELYKRNEAEQPCFLYNISKSAESVLNRIDYSVVISKRVRNFNFLASGLASVNKLPSQISEGKVPFAYPLMLDKPIEKSRLYSKGIFFPTLWQEVNERPGENFEFERKLSSELIPLPIDHRYSEEDMKYIIKVILTLIK